MIRFTSKDLLKYIYLNSACERGVRRLKRYLEKHTAREALAEYRRCRKFWDRTSARYAQASVGNDGSVSWTEYDRSEDFKWLCETLDLGNAIKDTWGYQIQYNCSHVTVEQIARAIKRELHVK